MNVLVVDDEQLALDFFEAQLIKAIPNAYITKSTNFDINKDIGLLTGVDIVFLDIEMPHINGLELATQISEVKPQLPIVFVTAFNKYAVQAFELNALDYVMKPVHAERLKNTINRVPLPKKIAPLHAPLRIRLCEEFQVSLEDKAYTTLKWRTTKAQELFLYLLHYRGKTVQKDELVEILWEDTPADKAFAQLYTTIYYIRRNLASYEPKLLLKNEKQGYLLHVNDVEIDIADWESRLTAAPPVEQGNLQQHEAIMALYTGGYLASYHYTWAEAERFRLEQLWVNHAKRMVLAYQANNNSDIAIQWLTKIITMSPSDEEAHFDMMKIYADLDYGMLVSHHYKSLDAELRDLEVSMSPKIEKWYQNWKRERAGNLFS